jgi:hypothetical protein
MKARLARDAVFPMDDTELDVMSKTLDEYAGEIVRLGLA